MVRKVICRSQASPCACCIKNNAVLVVCRIMPDQDSRHGIGAGLFHLPAPWRFPFSSGTEKAHDSAYLRGRFPLLARRNRIWSGLFASFRIRMRALSEWRRPSGVIVGFDDFKTVSRSLKHMHATDAFHARLGGPKFRESSSIARRQQIYPAMIAPTNVQGHEPSSDNREMRMQPIFPMDSSGLQPIGRNPDINLRKRRSSDLKMRS